MKNLLMAAENNWRACALICLIAAVPMLHGCISIDPAVTRAYERYDKTTGAAAVECLIENTEDPDEKEEIREQYEAMKKAME